MHISPGVLDFRGTECPLSVVFHPSPFVPVVLTTVAATTLMAFMATTRSLAVAASWTSTDSLSLAVLLNAAMDIVQVHDGDRLNV